MERTRNQTSVKTNNIGFSYSFVNIYQASIAIICKSLTDSTGRNTRCPDRIFRSDLSRARSIQHAQENATGPMQWTDAAIKQPAQHRSSHNNWWAPWNNQVMLNRAFLRNWVRSFSMNFAVRASYKYKNQAFQLTCFSNCGSHPGIQPKPTGRITN